MRNRSTADHAPKTHRRRRRVVLLLAALTIWLAAGGSSTRAQERESALANEPYDAGQVMTMIGRIDRSVDAPRPHAAAVVVDGYVAVPFGNSGPHPRSGIAVFDLSDPTKPVKVGGSEGDDNLLSEQHAMGFHRIDGNNFVAMLAVGGIEIWDWTNVKRPVRLSRLELPGVHVGYALGAWWLSWQAPYIYVGGASNGLFIVDAHDPANPQLVQRDSGPNPLPVTETGGFRVGPVFAVGNLLVLSRNDGPGYATMDISDPRNPVLLDVILDGSTPSYSSMVNGNHIYAAGIDDKLHVFDISDPAAIKFVGSPRMGSRGGYLTIQDGFAHVGASEQYAKIDVRDDANLHGVAVASSHVDDRDEDFAVVLGNLVLVGDDHGNGTFIFPHQAEPDRLGPRVTMVSPADDALGQARTSRIGLTFSDQLDLRTVNAETIVIRPVGGAALTGRYSYQTGIVNFWPDEPLMPDNAYEVIVPAGGVSDVVGNATPDAFRSTFSTGRYIDAPIHCVVDPVRAAPMGQPVDFRVSVMSRIGSTTHSWTFGDGSPPTAPSGVEGARHTFAQAGHYIVRAVVGNEKFRTGCATQVTVHRPIIPGHASASSTILFDPDRNRVWNVNPDNDTVSVLSAVSHEKLFERPVGRHPRTLAQAPDGAIWVVNQDDATIYVLGAENGYVEKIIALPRGSAPYGIVFTPDRDHALVTLQATGEVVRLDPIARSITGRVQVGPSPRGLAASHAEARVFVTRYLSPDSQGEIYELDPKALRLVAVRPLAIDPGPDTEASGRGLPNALASPVVSPDGQRLWVPSKKDNIVRGLQRDGLALTFESTVRPIVSQLNLVTGIEQLTGRIDFNDREGPVAVLFAPLGDFAFVLLQGSGAVEIVDAFSGRQVTAIEEAGIAPQGMALTSDGTKLFVHSWLTRAVHVYDVSNIIVPGRDQTAQLLDIVPVVGQDLVAQATLRGKQIFYNAADLRMSRDGYISCASCHLDGGHDGRVWDRTAEGEGLRNTIDLRSMPTSGRLHWSANFDEVQDFEQDMRLLFGGSGFLADPDWQDPAIADSLGAPKSGLSAELDTLAAYVSSLAAPSVSPFRSADGRLDTAGEQGRALFLRLGCAVCHGGEQWTDSSEGLLHNLGSITAASGGRRGGNLPGVDTPPLVNLWQSAPYLHDGSAPDLRSALLLTGGWHGDVASLSPDELDALVSFLQQLDATEPVLTGPVPAITVVRPQQDAMLAFGDPVRVAVNTSTGLDGVARVLFFVDGQVIGSDSTPIYATEWQPEAPGLYAIAAQLEYVNGATTMSATRQVTVTE